MKIILALHKMLENVLRRKGIVPWESLSDIPENVIYVVTGLMPANLFRSDRPLVLSRADQIVGPMIFHDSRQVGIRLLMAKSDELNLHHRETIGIGDAVMRVGDKLNLHKKQQLNYFRPTPSAA